MTILEKSSFMYPTGRIGRLNFILNYCFLIPFVALFSAINITALLLYLNASPLILSLPNTLISIISLYFLIIGGIKRIRDISGTLSRFIKKIMVCLLSLISLTVLSFILANYLQKEIFAILIVVFFTLLMFTPILLFIYLCIRKACVINACPTVDNRVIDLKKKLYIILGLLVYVLSFSIYIYQPLLHDYLLSHGIR